MGTAVQAVPQLPFKPQFAQPVGGYRLRLFADVADNEQTAARTIAHNGDQMIIMRPNSVDGRLRVQGGRILPGGDQAAQPLENLAGYRRLNRDRPCN